MVLKQEIEKLKKELAEKLPPEDLEVLATEVQKLTESGIAGKALEVGDKIKPFTLPNGKGESIALKDVLSKGPVVIKFYRGGWCPFCNLELQAYQKALPQIKEWDASLIAISPETPDHTLTTQESNELGFEVLSDAHNTVARSFGLVFRYSDILEAEYKKLGLDITKFNAEDSWELPIPATYVVDGTYTVRASFVNPNYTQRAEPRDVINVLRKLAQ